MKPVALDSSFLLAFDVSLLIRLGVSLTPVLAFLVILVSLDSFKLVRLRAILTTIAIGGLAALLCLLINRFALQELGWDLHLYSRYAAPVLEELVKALYVIYLIKTKRAGFMVDSAIYGFASGAGFACLENIYYIQSLPGSQIWVWLIRGFGTAIMHGGATAIFALLAKNVSDQQAQTGWRTLLPAWLAASAVHSFYNHFVLPPQFMAILLLLTLPALLALVFQRSEKSTRAWLEVGFDSDRELLELITSEQATGSRIGAYLQTLRKTFPPEVVVDILCYLRLYLELSIKAKGVLLMREAGFTPAPDPRLKQVFAELQYLKKEIGATGLLAISPFLSTTSRDLWQLQMLEQT